MDQQNPLDNIFNLAMDEEAKVHLKGAAFWAKLNAIIAFAMVGLNILAIVLGNQSAAGMAASLAFSLIGILISILLNVFLLRFGQRTLEAMGSSNQQLFVDGINNLRHYFKILGILLIIVCGLVIILVIFAVLAAVMTAT